MFIARQTSCSFKAPLGARCCPSGARLNRNLIYKHFVPTGLKKPTGATPNQEMQDVGEGIKVATVKDPFGNVFGIIENPSFAL